MYIKVGIAVVIINNNKVLIGKRINSHGEGTWGFPGGHLEFGETLESCAIRETMEETGLVIDNVSPGPFTNDIFLEKDKHYVTLFMIAVYRSGTPEVKEKNKCLEWRWVDYHDLPSPLFLPIQNLINQGYTFDKLKSYLN